MAYSHGSDAAPLVGIAQLRPFQGFDPTRRPQQRHQVAAGRLAEGGEALWIQLVLAGVGPQEDGTRWHPCTPSEWMDVVGGTVHLLYKEAFLW